MQNSVKIVGFSKKHGACEGVSGYFFDEGQKKVFQFIVLAPLQIKQVNIERKSCLIVMNLWEMIYLQDQLCMFG